MNQGHKSQKALVSVSTKTQGNTNTMWQLMKARFIIWFLLSPSFLLVEGIQHITCVVLHSCFIYVHRLDYVTGFPTVYHHLDEDLHLMGPVGPWEDGLLNQQDIYMKWSIARKIAWDSSNNRLLSVLPSGSLQPAKTERTRSFYPTRSWTVT